MTIVVFEETGEEREVVRVCGRCAVNRDWNNKLTAEDCTVVSVYGCGHLGAEYGMTACGIDATGDQWWHRL